MTLELDALPRPLRDLRRQVYTSFRPHQLLTTYRERVWRGTTCDVVLVTELAENEGASITNVVEAIYTAAVEEWPNAVVVEHYDADSYPGGRHPAANIRETFAVITVTGDGPTWHPIPARVFTALVRTADPGFVMTIRDAET